MRSYEHVKLLGWQSGEFFTGESFRLVVGKYRIEVLYVKWLEVSYVSLSF